MKLHLLRTKTSIKLELRDEKNVLLSRASSKFETQKDFEKASNVLDIDATLLKAVIDAFETGGPSCIDLSKKNCAIKVRPMRSNEAEVFTGPDVSAAFSAALSATELDMEEPIIFWDNCEDIAALDIDTESFTDGRLLTLEAIPTPAFSWVTKSGGARLVYLASTGFTAEEVAAVAYLALLSSYTKMEIKADTRHPAYLAGSEGACGQVYRRLQTFDPGHLRRQLRIYSATDSEALDYLAERNLVPGINYEHSHCPIDPDHESHGKPVTVLDKGLYCFSCAARGVCVGSSQPGFFPFAYLCGNNATSLVYRAMENKVHWEHARFIVESKLGLTSRYAALIYSAGLLLHGCSRKLIAKCFASGRNFVRMSGRWTNLNGESYTKDIKPLLASLPACYIPGTEKFDRSTITRFEQAHDLAVYGYPSIKPIYGCRIWQHSTELTAVIQNRDLSDESMLRFRPAYRAPAKRLSNAWSILERAMPGLNRAYLRLLIAARGIADGAASMPPMIFAAGVSGSGKSLTVSAAASICGDSNTEVVWDNNTSRLRQAIVDATGSFVTFNEVFKEAKGNITALDFILNLTPDSVSHYMYEGPARMGSLPVIVLSDTELPIQVKQNIQHARRMTYVHLDRRVDWDASGLACGMKHPKDLRLLGEVNAEACNTVLSEVIDEFFREPTTFQQIASQLGFKSLIDSREAIESRDILTRFYVALCAHPDANGESFVVGKGWKMVQRDMSSLLQRAWIDICEDNFTSTRRCSEVDWQGLLNAKHPVRFELRTHGPNLVAMRFVDPTGQVVNEELT